MEFSVIAAEFKENIVNPAILVLLWFLSTTQRTQKIPKAPVVTTKLEIIYHWILSSSVSVDIHVVNSETLNLNQFVGHSMNKL